MEGTVDSIEKLGNQVETVKDFVILHTDNFKENGESYGLTAMRGRKVVDRKTEEHTDMLELKETVDELARAKEIRWYGHVLGRDDDNVLRIALDLEVCGNRKHGRPRKTWKKQVEEETGRLL